MALCISRQTSIGTRLRQNRASSRSDLLEALRTGLKRYEHALVWGVLYALRRAAENPMCCQHFLLAGLMSVLQKAQAFYHACDERLPLPAERPKAAPPPTVTAEPPSFLRPVAPALERYIETVKDRWLATSTSLPDLRRKMPVLEESANSQDTSVGQPMWLVCEEGGDIRAFYRECSKSFFLLRVASLIARLEKCKTAFVEPLKQSGPRRDSIMP